MAKCGPRRNQTKYILLEMFWWELLKNVTFIVFEPLCQKLWAFCQIYQNHSPNMVMSRDSGIKFWKFLIFAQFPELNFRKSYYISVLKNSIEYSFVCFKYFIIHRLGDWNRSCTLSLFWGQFCMEKLYGELIECIIRAYRVNRYDNCPVNFFFSSCVILYEGTQRTQWIANSD